ncbi:MAG: hypothetical protein ACJ07L_16300 [Opitutales bacterium]
MKNIHKTYETSSKQQEPRPPINKRSWRGTFLNGRFSCTVTFVGTSRTFIAWDGLRPMSVYLSKKAHKKYLLEWRAFMDPIHQFFSDETGAKRTVLMPNQAGLSQTKTYSPKAGGN